MLKIKEVDVAMGVFMIASMVVVGVSLGYAFKRIRDSIVYGGSDLRLNR